MGKFISFVIAVCLFFQGVPYGFVPTVSFDCSSLGEEVQNYATGCLYGIASEGVPSNEAIKSLDLSSVSQKVAGGLQHPVGDITDVADELDSCDYVTVYLQDCYSTWYYCESDITEQKKAGTYDSMTFVRESFEPQVKKAVKEISAMDISQKVVYCPFNECDNAVWFGTWYDGYSHFDEEGRQNFYAAWKEVYDIIRDIDSDALIGGPGYCDYDKTEIQEFLEFCRDNDCLPDIMIYHELYDNSAAFLSDHVEEYREIESTLGIAELPIIITEYGTMQECGNPADMLHYVTAFEETGVYGNIAFWRLADNLCDLITDGNVPNSAYWLYKWYADMSGKLIDSKIVDVLHADFANTIKYERKSFHYTQLDGMASYDEDAGKIDIICGAADYNFNLVLKNIGKILGKKLNVNIEAVTYEGLEGEVYSPTTIANYNTTCLNKLSIPITGKDAEAVYHVTITAQSDAEDVETSTLPTRFEFEDGTLTGSAYTYDSAYATTGNTEGMCGGFENDGDGVKLTFKVPESGEYTLSLVYGNSNDGKTSADRCDTIANMSLDGSSATISLKNTIKSEYTDKYTFTAELTKGKHTIELSHNSGTFVLDSLLVKKSETASVYCSFDADENQYLIVAPADDYYNLEPIGVKYLKRGLNYIDAEEITSVNIIDHTVMQAVSAEEMTLNSAKLKNTAKGKAVSGITAESGSASFTVDAEKAGTYAITITYSNNGEGGVHAYNVDLLEEYVKLTANGSSVSVPCVNTHAETNLNTAVVYVDLKAGENTVTLSGAGKAFNGKIAESPLIFSVTINPESE